MKKYILLPIFLLVLFSQTIANAWPGCCSHHQGVCGCGCCDGSSLSAICAPHYPSCNSNYDSSSSSESTGNSWIGWVIGLGFFGAIIYFGNKNKK